MEYKNFAGFEQLLLDDVGDCTEETINIQLTLWDGLLNETPVTLFDVTTTNNFADLADFGLFIQKEIEALSSTLPKCGQVDQTSYVAWNNYKLTVKNKNSSGWCWYTNFLELEKDLEKNL